MSVVAQNAQDLPDLFFSPRHGMIILALSALITEGIKQMIYLSHGKFTDPKKN